MPGVRTRAVPGVKWAHLTPDDQAALRGLVDRSPTASAMTIAMAFTHRTGRPLSKHTVLSWRKRWAAQPQA